MRKLHTCLAAALAAAMMLAPARALAAGEPSKEEVVYAYLTSDGTAEAVDVVNIFNLTEAGEIEDRGTYASVRNMTGPEEIDYDGKTAVIDAGPGRLYYEGRMADPVIPWRVTLGYELDGQAISPADLAGQSGALAIHITVERDPNCSGDFFDRYALQTVITLDTALCTNIAAEGATVVNVGGSKQLTYTALPGAGADMTVTADVTDFEMEGIAINGLLLSLDTGIDIDSLTKEFTDLTDAIQGLNTGAAALAEAMAALSAASGEMNVGLAGLAKQSAALAAGSAALAAETEGLKGTVQDKIGGTLSALAGDGPVTSFTSSENKNVTALQFVITAPDIRIPAPEMPKVEPAADRTFWQKLTDLF